MKQYTLFADDEQVDERYAVADGSPLYVPKGRPPDVRTLVDKSKVRALIANIDASSCSDAEKAFLRDAAMRHAVFHYERCADYYAHARPEMQRLMEASALVIPDIDSAIEHGFVKLCDCMKKLYIEEVIK